MKKVLIPVDFSLHANKAIEMACTLAKVTYHDIDLIHVFTDHSNIYQNSIDDARLIDPRVGSAKREMQKIIAAIVESHPDINVNAIFKDGSLYQEIKKLTDSNTYDAIIMGTKGASGLEAFLSSSNMFGVFHNTSTPVLAVPLLEKPYRIDKIGLLVNFKDGEIAALNQATQIFGNSFELLLIHVNLHNDTEETIHTKFESFIERIINETAINDMGNIAYIIKKKSLFIQQNEQTTEAVESIIAEEDINVLLVTKSKKNLYRKITEENIVKRMAHRLKIPKFFAKSPQ